MVVLMVGSPMLVTSSSPTALGKKTQIVHLVLREFTNLDPRGPWEDGPRCRAVCGKFFAHCPPDDRPQAMCSGCQRSRQSTPTIRVALQDVVQVPAGRP